MGMALQAAEKSEGMAKTAKEHLSGAKAHRFLSSICGTTEVVP
jgi:hypothetical protein